MELVLQILAQLGANKTAFIQFAIFAVTIGFLTLVVFKPYFKAFEQRQEKTKGAENVAKEAVDEARMLESIYQQKAREINDKIKGIYDQKRTEGQKIAEGHISNAKKESEEILKQTRAALEKETTAARGQITNLTGELVSELSKKFEGGL